MENFRLTESCESAHNSLEDLLAVPNEINKKQVKRADLEYRRCIYEGKGMSKEFVKSLEFGDISEIDYEQPHTSANEAARAMFDIRGDFQDVVYQSEPVVNKYTNMCYEENNFSDESSNDTSNYVDYDDARKKKGEL